MSRSNPTSNEPHPCQRWHEWDGSNGFVKYFDKEAINLKDKTKKGENIVVNLPFVFILLDETASVKGWHDASDSGIYSNEVRDTRADTLVVKAFKGGILAEGLYSQIRDTVVAQGAHFTTILYIGFKDKEGNMALGSLALKGAALNAWVEFRKANRADIFKKAIKIASYVQGKKGAIIFRTPVFGIQEISDKTNTEALALDSILQHYLKGYFGRTRTEQISRPPVEPAEPVDDGAEAERAAIAAADAEAERQLRNSDPDVPF